MKSIAVIGASANREKFGNKCVRAYKQLGWRVFPVNPKENEVEGLKCYSSVLQLPVVPDRVSIYLPPQVTLSIIPELAEAGIKSVVLNPGAESAELVSALSGQKIFAEQRCSIRMEGIDPESL